MRVKTLLLIAVLLVFFSGKPAHALTGALLGNNSELQLRGGFRPLQRTEIGVTGLWQDRNNVVGGGLYVTYDVVHAQDFNIFGLATVPATIPIGGIIGGQDGDDLPAPQVADAFVSLLTAILFGDEKIQLGFEYQYGLDEDALGWSDLGSVPDQHKLFFVLKYIF